jgi:hypothetical protein
METEVQHRCIQVDNVVTITAKRAAARHLHNTGYQLNKAMREYSGRFWEEKLYCIHAPLYNHHGFRYGYSRFSDLSKDILLFEACICCAEAARSLG